MDERRCYAWARRAKSYGRPLREATAHLVTGAKAVHQAYSEIAEIVTLLLEFYEKEYEENILKFIAITKTTRSPEVGNTCVKME